MKTQRNLSGVYFRERIGDGWGHVCFEDLNKSKQEEILEAHDPEWLKSLVLILAGTLNEIGEQLDIAKP